MSAFVQLLYLNISLYSTPSVVTQYFINIPTVQQTASRMPWQIIPDGSAIGTRWGEILNLPNPSGRTRLWGLLSLWQKWVLETLKKIMFLGSKVRPVR
jgi:hypothetical protein